MLSRYRVFITPALFLVYGSVFFFLSAFTDTAKLARDTWSYQSIAVNFAKGYGFHTTGNICDFNEYKFENDLNQRYLNKFNAFGGFTDVHRNLGYPLFLSMVYYVFGIHPLAAKYIQLAMLVFIAALLPRIGHHYWGKTGYVSGFIAGPFFLAGNYRLAGSIMSEPLVAFAVLLIVMGCIYFEIKKTTGSGIVLGIVFGICLLIQGSLILIPPLYVGYYLIKNPGGYFRCLMLVFFTAIVVLPWSVFISRKAKLMKNDLVQIKQLVLDNSLSINEKNAKINDINPAMGKGLLPSRNFTEPEKSLLIDSILPQVRRNGFILQGAIITDMDKLCLLEQAVSTSSFALLRYLIPLKGFLDVHNEYMKEGEWRPEWRNDKKSFYNNDGMGNSPAAFRIANYYLYHPSQILSNIIFKIQSGFSGFVFLWIILLLYLTERVVETGCTVSLKRNRVPKVVLCFVLALPIPLIVFYYKEILSGLPIIPVLIGACLLMYLITKTNKSDPIAIGLKAPVIFLTVFINFLLITVIAMGVERWIRVMDFLFVLTAVYYALKCLEVYLLNISV